MQQTRELETATQVDQIRFVGFSSDETFSFSWFHLLMFSIKMGWSPIDFWWFSYVQSPWNQQLARPRQPLWKVCRCLGRWSMVIFDRKLVDLPEAIHYSPVLTTIHAPCSSIFIHFHPCSSIFIHLPLSLPLSHCYPPWYTIVSAIFLQELMQHPECCEDFAEVLASKLVQCHGQSSGELKRKSLRTLDALDALGMARLCYAW